MGNIGCKALRKSETKVGETCNYLIFMQLIYFIYLFYKLELKKIQIQK